MIYPWWPRSLSGLIRGVPNDLLTPSAAQGQTDPAPLFEGLASVDTVNRTGTTKGQLGVKGAASGVAALAIIPSIRDAEEGADPASSNVVSTLPLTYVVGDLIKAEVKWEGTAGGVPSVDFGASTRPFTIANAVVDHNTAGPNDLHSATLYLIATTSGTTAVRFSLTQNHTFKAVRAYSVAPPPNYTFVLESVNAAQGTSASPSSGPITTTGPSFISTTFALYGSRTLTPGVPSWQVHPTFNTLASIASEYQNTLSGSTVTGDGALSSSIEWIAQVASFKLVLNSARSGSAAGSVGATGASAGKKQSTATTQGKVGAKGTAEDPVIVNPGVVAAYALNEGTGTTTADISGNALTGTITGAPWVAGHTSNALNFTGTQVVDLGTSALLRPTGDMTVSAWLRVDSFIATDQAAVSNRDGLGGWQLDVNIDNANRAFGLNVTTSNGLNVRYSSTIPVLNQWYYVTGVYRSAAQQLDIYVNGVLDNGILLGTIGVGQTVSSLATMIGQRPSGVGTFPFNGTVDDVRIYSRALSGTEILVDMNSPVGQGFVFPSKGGTGTQVGSVGTSGSVVGKRSISGSSVGAIGAKGTAQGTASIATGVNGSGSGRLGTTGSSTFTTLKYELTETIGAVGIRATTSATKSRTTTSIGRLGASAQARGAKGATSNTVSALGTAGQDVSIRNSLNNTSVGRIGLSAAEVGKRAAIQIASIGSIGIASSDSAVKKILIATSVGAVGLKGTASGTASAIRTGSGAGTIGLSASASSASVRSTTVSGRIGLKAQTLFSLSVTRTAAGSQGITSSDTAKKTISFSAVGSLGVASAATGKKQATSAASTGSAGLSATEIGKQSITLSTTGAVGVRGVETGTRTASGSSIGRTGLSGTSSGASVAPHVGIVSAKVGLSATEAGKKSVTSTSAGSIGITGTETGISKRTATTVGRIGSTGSSSTVSVSVSSAAGTLGISSVAVGRKNVVSAEIGRIGASAALIGITRRTNTAVGRIGATGTSVGVKFIPGQAFGSAVGRLGLAGRSTSTKTVQEIVFPSGGGIGDYQVGKIPRKVLPLPKIPEPPPIPPVIVKHAVGRSVGAAGLTGGVRGFARITLNLFPSLDKLPQILGAEAEQELLAAKEREAQTRADRLFEALLARIRRVVKPKSYANVSADLRREGYSSGGLGIIGSATGVSNVSPHTDLTEDEMIFVLTHLMAPRPLFRDG